MLWSLELEELRTRPLFRSVPPRRELLLAGDSLGVEVPGN
jgi:hypothetical protein